MAALEVDGGAKGSGARPSQRKHASGGVVDGPYSLWREGVTMLFGSLSRRVSQKPLQVLVLSLSVAAICCAGLGWMDSHRYSARLSHLYDVHRNPARDSQARIESAFHEKMPQEATVYVTPVGRKGNLLDKSTLLSVLDLYETIQDNVTGATEQFRHKNVCYRPAGVRSLCDAVSIVNYWGKTPRQNINRDVNLPNTLTSRLQEPDFEDLFGRHLDPNSILSKLQRDSLGKILGLEAARMRFRTKNDAMRYDSLDLLKLYDGRDPHADTWQEALRHFIRQFRSSSIKVEVLTDFDQQLYIPNTSPLDMVLAAIGITGALVYSGLAMSAGHTPAASAWVVFASLAGVVMASACMLSISVLADIYNAPATLVAILFLFGVGTNSMFFLVSAVSRAVAEVPAASGPAEAEAAREEAMSAGGLFVGRASLASFLAMCAVLATAGGISEVRFVHSALLQTLLGLAFLFFFQWTFFVACVAVDLHGGIRTLCQGLWWGVHAEEKQANDKAPPVTAPTATIGEKIVCSWLPETLVHPFGTFLVLLITVVLLALGALSSAQSRVGFNPRDLIPTDDYLSLAMETRDKYFPEGYAPIPFEVVTKFSFASPWLPINNKLVLNTTKILSERLKSNKYVSRVDSWYDSFIEWAPPNSSYASVPKFFEGLENFLSDKGSRYQKDVLYFTSSETLPFIQVSRITGTLNHPPTPNAQVEVLHALKKLAKREEGGEETIVWSPKFAEWEGFEEVRREIPIMIGCAAAAACLALLLSVGSVHKSTLVLGATVAITVEVAGFLFAIDRSLNPLTVTVLFLSIAISLHSSTFTVLASFSLSTSFQVDRLQASWFYAGGPVLHSSLAFLIAILPMVGARSLALRTLFQMLAVTTALGLWHNLVALPLLISVFLHFTPFGAPTKVGIEDCPGNDNKGPNSKIGEDGLLKSISLKFRPLPRIAPFVTIPENAVLEGNQSVFTLE